MKTTRGISGDVFHQPRKRPHGRGNPMRDPFVLLGARGPSGAHGHSAAHGHRGARTPGAARRPPRARDRREFEPVDVREIRRQFDQTRRQFAEMMGISPETLRNWERGRRWPQGSARALLRIARADPDLVAAVLVRNRVPWGRTDPTDGS